MRPIVGSRKRLTPRDARRFEGDALFAKVARAVAGADCLPVKELFESWEVARRARRRFRGGRVVDLACGHGLLAHLMVLLDDSSPLALAVDPALPPSAARIAGVMEESWPRLAGRVQHVRARMEDVPLGAGDVVVSAHACGALTDVVLERAAGARARVVVLPCCQAKGVQDGGGLGGWLEPGLAIDVTRAHALRARGYVVHTQRIPEAITPKNRLLFGAPGEWVGPMAPV